MSVLLAIGEPSLSEMLRKPLVENGFDVLPDEVLHRNFLNEFIDIQQPDMVIIHDVYLPSEFDHNQAQRDAEILSLIEDWRMQYNTNLRVVYLCVRDKKDPFLAKLVARNVLDIFYEQGLQTQAFIKQLKEEPRFSNVTRFGTGELELEFNDTEKVFENTSDIDSPEIDGGAKKENAASKIAQSLSESAKGLKNSIAQKRAEAKANAPEKPKPTPYDSGIDETIFDEMIDLMPVEKQQPPKPQIIGTVLVAVAGVESHLGATHTAISIASYLKDKGHSVALVESNHSQDFDRIHALYEGEKRMLLNDSHFEMKGLIHFKYREDQNLNDIFSNYEYVVMDFGNLNEAANIDEFTRAHVKCVLCSADEWKFHWIKEFSDEYAVDNTYCFLVPGVSMEKIDDLYEQIEAGSVSIFPTQDDPYEPSKEVGEMINDILGDFIKIPLKSSTKLLLVGTSLGSIALTVLIFFIFKVLR